MDIKLESATGEKNDFSLSDEFLLVARDSNVFAKVVFDENITEKEILELANLGLKHGIEIILQPKMPMSKNLDAAGIFQKLYNKYSRIRLIPQVHKYLNLP